MVITTENVHSNPLILVFSYFNRHSRLSYHFRCTKSGNAHFLRRYNDQKRHTIHCFFQKKKVPLPNYYGNNNKSNYILNLNNDV